MRERRIAEQPRALGAQCHHFGNDLLVVGRAAAVAACDPGAKDLLAQIAPGGELQERLHARARGGDDVLAGKATLLGRRLGGCAHEIGKPGEVVLAVEHERVALLVRQHVLAEGRAEGGEAFVDFAEPRFRSGIERGARTLVHRVIAIEHARLFRRQAELPAAAVKRVDPPIQALVHEDSVPMLGRERRQLALDLLDRVVRVRAGEEIEDV